MTNSTTLPIKTFVLVIFCSLFFLRSNAQHKNDRHEQASHNDRQRSYHNDRQPSQQVNREPHSQHQTQRINDQPVRPQQPPSTRGNHGQPAPSTRPTPHTQPVVHSTPASRPPVHSITHPDRTFRAQVRVAPRPGYQFYNNGYRYHYTNRPPVYNAHNPGWRYSYLPPRRAIITSFPFQYQTINYGGYGYRFYNGTYYRPYNNAFIVVAPPVGLFINVLPFGYRRIYVNQNPYYYYNGTYYDEYENNYRVVAPPVGAVVESIPEGYETVTIDGETYYKVDGVQYKPVVQENGEIWYEVIKVD